MFYYVVLSAMWRDDDNL